MEGKEPKKTEYNLGRINWYIPAPASKNELHYAPQKIVKIELEKPAISQMVIPCIGTS